LRVAAHLHRFHPDIDAAEKAFTSCWPDRQLDRKQLRLTTLVESTTAWRLLLSRTPHFEAHDRWPDAPGFIAAGAHFGNGIAIIWSLKQAGLNPRFVLRPPDRSLLLRRPAGFFWSLLRQRVLRRLCPEGLIHTGGAYRALESALQNGTSTPVILFDTPIQASAHEWTVSIGQCRYGLPTGARDLAIKSQSEIIYFLPKINPDSLSTRIRLYGRDANQLSTNWSEWLGEQLDNNPEQWHLWHAIEPYLQLWNRS